MLRNVCCRWITFRRHSSSEEKIVCGTIFPECSCALAEKSSVSLRKLMCFPATEHCWKMLGTTTRRG